MKLFPSLLKQLESVHHCPYVGEQVTKDVIYNPKREDGTQVWTYVHLVSSSYILVRGNIDGRPSSHRIVSTKPVLLLPSFPTSMGTAALVASIRLVEDPLWRVELCDGWRFSFAFTVRASTLDQPQRSEKRRLQPEQKWNSVLGWSTLVRCLCKASIACRPGLRSTQRRWSLNQLDWTSSVFGCCREQSNRNKWHQLH